MSENARENVPPQLPGDIDFAQNAHTCEHPRRQSRQTRRGERGPIGGHRCWSHAPDWLADPCDLETWLITHHAQTAGRAVQGETPLCSGSGADGI